MTVPLVSDNEAAKNRVSEIVDELGLEPFDAGPLIHARVLEGMALIYMVPYMSGRRQDAFEYYFRRGAAPEKSEGVRPAG